MGCGKTTIGKIVQKKSDIPLIDLDKYIVNEEQKTISQIFEEKGERYFRNLENKYLNQILKDKKESLIIALGGGTPCNHENQLLLKKGTSFYLKASVDKLYSVLKNDSGKRPLLKKMIDLRELITQQLNERSPFYEKADMVIVTDGKKDDDIANEIMDYIESPEKMD